MDVRTEMGMMRVRPNEICVIPRGIRFNVSLPAGSVRGFAMEVYEGHFDLPELGPIGSCGLANIRDFQIPVASYETSDASTTMFVKFAGKMYRTSYRHSIFNVAGWHGTYYPFKYDLRKFRQITFSNAQYNANIALRQIQYYWFYILRPSGKHLLGEVTDGRAKRLTCGTRILQSSQCSLYLHECPEKRLPTLSYSDLAGLSWKTVSDHLIFIATP